MLSHWLLQSWNLLWRHPLLWAMFLFVSSPLLALGVISPFLGILFAVLCLFLGVSVAAYADKQLASLQCLLRQCLPLALLAALALVSCWLVFRILADLNSNNAQNIALFFWLGSQKLTALQSQTWRLLTAGLFELAIVTLIFTLLMLTSFASWFSFPLMTLKGYVWSVAKSEGQQAAIRFRPGMTRLMYSSGLLIIFGLGWLPCLTPLVYLLISLLMYVTYKEAFIT